MHWHLCSYKILILKIDENHIGKKLIFFTLFFSPRQWWGWEDRSREGEDQTTEGSGEPQSGRTDLCCCVSVDDAYHQ